MAVRRLDAEPTFVEMSAPESVSVGTTSAQVLAANPERRFLAIGPLPIAAGSDPFARRVSLAFGAGPAVLDKGITLLPGDVLILDRGGITTQAVHAVAAAAHTVTIQEGV